MSYEPEIRQLASLFEGRLVENLPDSAMEYLDHGEVCLALEMLCDFLCEEDVAISHAEYQELVRLGSLVGANLKAGRFRYLRNLMAPR